jgi:hypothetical protein
VGPTGHVDVPDVETHGLAKATLKELAAAALELRKRHPRARLLVCGPERLVRQLERRYPPLVDVAIDQVSADSVLTALNDDGNFRGKTA